jgi:hypothetical protein
VHDIDGAARMAAVLTGEHGGSYSKCDLFFVCLDDASATHFGQQGFPVADATTIIASNQRFERDAQLAAGDEPEPLGRPCGDGGVGGRWAGGSDSGGGARGQWRAWKRCAAAEAKLAAVSALLRDGFAVCFVDAPNVFLFQVPNVAGVPPPFPLFRR